MKHAKKILALTACAVALGVGSAQAAPGRIDYTNTVIGTSTRWTSNNVYHLFGYVIVASNATLRIDQGTIIRGHPKAEDPLNATPGYLLISRGSKIKASGTAEHPIIFTDKDDSNVALDVLDVPVTAKYHPPLDSCNWSKLSGLWGGVMVCGKTYLNKNCGDAGPTESPINEAQVEGTAAVGTLGLHGGVDDDDSGWLTYCVTRYGGYPLSAAFEINGWSFGSVGRGTVLHHLETVHSQDDGFEFWGGTVDAKYLITWGQGDDGFDTDEGYRGRRQFGFQVQEDLRQTTPTSESYLSDKGFEMDGGDAGDGNQPWTLTHDYNFTVVGKGRQGDSTGAGALVNSYFNIRKNSAFQIRDNGSPQVFNSILTDFGGAGVLIEQLSDVSRPQVDTYQRFITPAIAANYPTWTSGGSYVCGSTTFTLTTRPASYFYNGVQDTAENQGAIKDCIFWNMGAFDDAGIPWVPLTEANRETCGGDTANVGTLLSDPVTAFNAYANPLLTITRETSSCSLADRSLNVTSINPMPGVGSPALTSSRTAPVNGFFTPVAYKGAFYQYNWAKGWTTVDSMGLIAAYVQPAEAPTPTITFSGTTRNITFPTVAGILYVVESTTDQVKWSPTQTVLGDGNPATIVDSTPIEARRSYRVSLP